MLIDLTPADLKILTALLRKAGDEFSHHGCNDFHLIKEGGLTPREAEEMKTEMQVGLSGDDARVYDRDLQYDWALFRHFQRRFEKTLELSQN